MKLSQKHIQALATVLHDALDGLNAKAFTWADDKFWMTSARPAVRSQFIAIGNSINFRFWSQSKTGISPAEGVLDGETLVGSMYMWRRLRLIVERDEYPLLDANALADLSHRDLQGLLADDNGDHPLAPGFSDRLENLRNLGHGLFRDWDGQFINLLKASDEDLGTFFDLSARIRAYDDPLRKLSSVNAIMQSGSDLARFRQSIPPAIDYHVAKQLLRIGAVTVDPELEVALSDQRLLDSHAGMSIRTACLAALERACSQAGLPGDVVDNLLWSNRRVCTEPTPNCPACPLQAACEQRIEIQRPLEITRYY